MLVVTRLLVPLGVVLRAGYDLEVPRNVQTATILPFDRPDMIDDVEYSSLLCLSASLGINNTYLFPMNVREITPAHVFLSKSRSSVVFIGLSMVLFPTSLASQFAIVSSPSTHIFAKRGFIFYSIFACLFSSCVFVFRAITPSHVFWFRFVERLTQRYSPSMLVPDSHGSRAGCRKDPRRVRWRLPGHDGDSDLRPDYDRPRKR